MYDISHREKEIYKLFFFCFFVKPQPSNIPVRQCIFQSLLYTVINNHV